MKLEQQEQSRSLRATGQSIKQIARKLKVSPASVSRWVKDVVLSDSQKLVLKAKSNNQNMSVVNKARLEKYRDKRKACQQKGKNEAENGDKLHLTGCMLYWAEGGKKRNHLQLNNMDPELVRVFVDFLIESLRVNPDDIQIRCKHHGHVSDQEAGYFWIKHLSLPPECLRQVSQYEKKESKKKNKHRYGLCNVEVLSVDVIQRIYGAIKHYVGIKDDRWLD